MVGVDASADMVRAARERGVDARVADGRALAFDAEFNAVFTNAALHWMPEVDAGLDGVARALRQRGRFVGEFGGHSNVAAMRVALAAALERHGAPGSAMPLYFPRRAGRTACATGTPGARDSSCARGGRPPRRQSESRLTTIAS